MDLTPHIRLAQDDLARTEQALAEFDFGAAGGDQDAYRKLNRDYQRLKTLLDLCDEKKRAEGELEGSRELLQSEEDEEFLGVVTADIEKLEYRIAQLEVRIKGLILPPLPNEERNTIVEIRPAAGGDEAGLFAADLFRMYTRLAETDNWKLEVLDRSDNALGGLKSIVFSLQADDVFRYMRFESGVHRVQRIPVTESGGRIHTSTVTVAVLPEAEGDADVAIDPQDIRIDVFRSSGPGGQSVNTTDSAVRITHEPTGLVVTSQQEKSQHRNREIAMRILRSRLLEKKQEEDAAKSAETRRRQVGTGDRSERIRTYNFPQNRVTDHRYNITRYDLTDIMEGNLRELLDEILAVDVEQRLAEQVQ